MKKILASVIALTMAFGSAAVCAFADEAEDVTASVTDSVTDSATDSEDDEDDDVEEEFTYATTVLEDGTLRIDGVATGSVPENLIIPEEIDGAAVTEIAAEAFSGTYCVNVLLAESVTSIGDGAFKDCAYLTRFLGGETECSYGEGVFENCPNLRMEVVEDSTAHVYAEENDIEYILYSPENDFAYGYEVLEDKTVKIVEYFGWDDEVEIPDEINGKKVTVIGDSAFYASEITSLVIPEGVTTIETSAFSNALSLEEIKFPSTLTYIGGYAFEGTAWAENYVDEKIADNELPLIIINGILADAQYLEMVEYSDGSAVTVVDVPEGVVSVSDHAFAGCIKVEEINLPDGVTSIGEYAFAGCTSLKEITVPASVTEIGTDVFFDCANVKIFCYAGSAAETYAKENNIPYELLSTESSSSEGTTSSSTSSAIKSNSTGATAKTTTTTTDTSPSTGVAASGLAIAAIGAAAAIVVRKKK